MRDLEIYQTVKQIAGIACRTEACGTVERAYPNAMALQQIARLSDGLLSRLDAAAGFEATLAGPTQQSSVQIEGRAKGAPAITVKVYDADPAEALATARRIYDEAVSAYASQPAPGPHTNGVAT